MGLGALLAVATGLLTFTAEGGAWVPESYLPVLVSASVTVGFFPLSLLFAYFVRITLVTQRTAATLPFTTPEQEH